MKTSYSKNKKITLFIPNLGNRGGAESFTLSLAEGFHRAGFAVDVVMLDSFEPPLGFPVEIRFLVLNPLSRGRLRTVSAIPSLIMYGWKNRPAAFISSMPRNNICVAVAGFFWTQTRLVLIEHEHFSSANKRRGFFWRTFLPILMRIFYVRADAVVGVSKGVVEDLSTSLSLGNKVHTIYNPFDLQKISKQSLEEVDELLPDKYIVGVARLAPQKNFQVLLEAFSRLHTSFPELHLVICGEGEQEVSLKKLAQEYGIDSKTHFVGFKENPFPYMRKSMLLVSTSLWEGFSNILIEGMAAGTVIISSNCPSGPAEILGEGNKYGILTEVGNVQDLTEQITLLVNNEELRMKYLVAGEKRCLDFSTESTVSRYLQIIYPDS